MTAIEIKNAYGLFQTPSCVTKNLECAKFFKTDRHSIILGRDATFWVVRGRDAKTLRNLGFEQL